jgi:hypothetical protein
MKIASATKIGRKWVRYLIYGGLGLFLVVVAVILFVVWYTPPPLQVDVGGSAADLGAAYGRSLRLPMRLVTRFYVEGILCQNNPTLIQSRRATALEATANWPKPYAEELKAAASASGIPLGALAYGNCFLDLGNSRAGCRSVVITQADLFLHAHNLDWDNLGGFGRWTTCIIRRRPTDGRFQTVAVGFPGLIGALDIINEKGLALSFNQLGFGKGGTNEPVFVMLRRIAETCASMDQARSELFSAPAGMPFIITVSDAEAGQGSVFERTNDIVTERAAKEGWVAACNAAQGTAFGKTRLDEILAGEQITDAAGLRHVLASPGVLMESNIYCVIFDFRRNRLIVASGDIPAARGRFEEYRLFQ